ncbi:MAG: hypothetical protein LBI31_06285, partial [Zoogloeaceae bacterium]|nr:hypothetical protein [Zoogloeaceae bacterium]
MKPMNTRTRFLRFFLALIAPVLLAGCGTEGGFLQLSLPEAIIGVPLILLHEVGEGIEEGLGIPEREERKRLAYSCWQDATTVNFEILGGNRDTLGSITTDEAGNLYVTARSCVRRITPEGEVGILAGSSQGFADGKGA